MKEDILTNENGSKINTLLQTIEVLRVKISQEITRVKETVELLLRQQKSTFGIEADSLGQQIRYTERRLRQLEELRSTPFFARLVYLKDGVEKNRYISKYEFSSEEVSSWVSKIADLRFENIGNSTYSNEELEKINVYLKIKDSYTITLDRLIYYGEVSHEGEKIIYEDFFDKAKEEFGLKEIISRIEREQHAVLQSPYKIPLVLSGPAGSGKTTLSLHRIAYLMQTPETGAMLEGRPMLMLVGDSETKDYFASLLPKLGIELMQVSTFVEWVCGINGINNILQVESSLDIQAVKISLYESLIRFQRPALLSASLDALSKFYQKSDIDESIKCKIIAKVKKHELDYLDALIISSGTVSGNKIIKKESFVTLGKNGKYKNGNRVTDVEYGAIIVDEFQNYSDDQIGLVAKAMGINSSIMFVGDHKQKSITRRSSSLDRSNILDRASRIHLDKVHRNTKNILKYIASRGYEISVPDSQVEGLDVVESYVSEEKTAANYLIEFLLKYNEGFTCAVLTDSQALLGILQKSVAGVLAEERLSLIHFLTKTTSQGTEFDAVICFEELCPDDSSDVVRNRNYVGLTRARKILQVVKFVGS